jgi:hypothetical protein
VENSRGLFDTAANAKHQWEVSKKEHQEQFQELTLLWTRGSKQCFAIVGPPRVRNHLSEGMRLMTIGTHKTSVLCTNMLSKCIE